MTGAPAEVRWEDEVSDFIDRLVDADVRYVDVQLAIEHLIQSGLQHQIALEIGVFDDEVVYWHPMPPLFPAMRILNVFWTADIDGGLTVVLVEFA